MSLRGRRRLEDPIWQRAKSGTGNPRSGPEVSQGERAERAEGLSLRI